MKAKFSVLEQTQGLHLQAKFHLNMFIVSASGGQKPQFWANFDIFGGSCTDPLLPMQVSDLHLRFALCGSMADIQSAAAEIRVNRIRRAKFGVL